MAPTFQIAAAQGWNRKGFARPAAAGPIGLGYTPALTDQIGQGLITAGSMLLKAHPLAGAIVLSVGVLTKLIGGLFKPDITKQQTTAIVNQIEAEALKPLRDAWENLPAAAKTPDAQAAALLVFDNAWAAVKKACSNPAYGSAGQACVTDRQQGSCHWTVNGATPGAPPDCGNWFVWYRDPIANDPAVVANAVNNSPAGSGSSAGSASTNVDNSPAASTNVDNSKLYLGAALIGVALLVFLGGGE